MCHPGAHMSQTGLIPILSLVQARAHHRVGRFRGSPPPPAPARRRTERPYMYCMISFFNLFGEPRAILRDMHKLIALQ